MAAILSEDHIEQIIIQDTLNYSLDLFENQEKSKAVFPVIDIAHSNSFQRVTCREIVYDINFMGTKF